MIADKDKEKEKEKIPVSAEQLDALRKCIEDTLRTYKKKRTRNRGGAVFVHIGMIIATVLTTVILGWQLGTEEAAKTVEGVAQAQEGYNKLSLVNFALIGSAITTGISTLDSVFDFRALWVGYNIAISRLNSIKARLNYLQSIGAAHLDQKQIEELYNRYDAVCSSVEKDYKEIRTSDE